MKITKRKKRLLLTLGVLLLLAFGLYLRLEPLRELGRFTAYQGTTTFDALPPSYDPLKKNVLIVADIKATEMFDMMAPFYLFNATGKANVYIVAEQMKPIAMNKGPFILPQLTFAQVDSMKLHADVIVIPYMDDPHGRC